jgi:hypothetical protein
MGSSEQTPTPVQLHDWLDQVRRLLPSDADLSLSDAEQRALLDVARIAAHRSERIAAPLSTFLVGLALGGLARGERRGRLADLVHQLEPHS